MLLCYFALVFCFAVAQPLAAWTNICSPTDGQCLLLCLLSHLCFRTAPFKHRTPFASLHRLTYHHFLWQAHRQSTKRASPIPALFPVVIPRLYSNFPCSLLAAQPHRRRHFAFVSHVVFRRILVSGRVSHLRPFPPFPFPFCFFIRYCFLLRSPSASTASVRLCVSHLGCFAIWYMLVRTLVPVSCPLVKWIPGLLSIYTYLFGCMSVVSLGRLCVSLFPRSLYLCLDIIPPSPPFYLFRAFIITSTHLPSRDFLFNDSGHHTTTSHKQLLLPTLRSQPASQN